MELYSRIRSRRIELNMSQQELAEKVGYTDRSSIAKIEAGINDLTQSKISAFAAALQCTPAYLMGWEEYVPLPGTTQVMDSMPEGMRERRSADTKEQQLSDNPDPQEQLPPGIYRLHETKRIPLLGRIAAGLPLYAEENIEGWLWTDRNHGGEYFALRVRGDSMNAARINDGDIVILRRQEEVEPGEIAAVLVDDEATLKRYSRRGKMVVLTPQSTNPENIVQVYSAEEHTIRILGKVVEIRIDC